MKRLIAILAVMPIFAFGKDVDGVVVTPGIYVYEEIGDLAEMRRRIDVLWAAHTNRQARISKARSKRVSAPKPKAPPTSPLRFAKPSKTGRRAK